MSFGFALLENKNFCGEEFKKSVTLSTSSQDSVDELVENILGMGRAPQQLKILDLGKTIPDMTCK